METRVGDVESKLIQLDRKMDKVITALGRIEAATVSNSGLSTTSANADDAE